MERNRRKYSELSGIGVGFLATPRHVSLGHFHLFRFQSTSGSRRRLQASGLSVPDFDWYLFVFNIVALAVWIGVQKDGRSSTATRRPVP